MIALAIVGAVFLLLFLLLLPSVRLHLSYKQGEAQVSLHYLFLRFRLFPLKEKPDAKEETDQEAEEADAKEPKEEEPQKKKSFAHQLEDIRDLVRSSGKALNRLRRHIIFYRLQGHIAIAREDAHQTALAYAKTALLLQTLLEVIGEVFVLKKHKLTLSPDFTRESSVYHLSLRIRFRPLFVLTAGVGVLLALLRNAHRGKKNSVSKGGSYESAASHR